MGERKLNFIFVPPSFGIKNPQMVTLNNVPKWWKFAKTKLKDEFKAQLSDWSLPPVDDDNPYTKADIEYTILRKNGVKIDSDNLAFPYKWLQDLLVENGYLVDDDQTRVVLNPTLLHVEGNVETSVRVEIHLKEKYIMTIDELKALIDVIKFDLEKVDTEDGSHGKPASGRVRKALGEIKNATPELRRTLVERDKQ